MDKRYQIFVSSTYTDLIEERKEVTRAILKCDCFPAGMELFPAANEEQWSIIKKVIDDSDFFLLIIAGRYGSIGTDDNGKKVSYTEMEFDYALSTKKPILVMLHRDPESLPVKYTEKSRTGIQRLKKFREKASKNRMVAFWNNSDQLNNVVSDSLRYTIAHTPNAIGWVRADNVTVEAKKLKKSIQFIEKFKELNNDEEKIKYIDSLDTSDRIDIFKEEDFVKVYTGLIDKEKSVLIISEALKLIPKAFLSKEIKQMLIDKTDICLLFETQCFDASRRNNEFFASIILTLCALDIFFEEYAMAILEIIRSGEIDPVLQKACVRYLTACNAGCPKDEFEVMLQNYILSELKNEKRLLPLKDLLDILAAAIKNETHFILLYDLFIDGDLSVRKGIVDCILTYCSTYIYILNPKIQRMFLEICNEVFSWDDDEIIAQFLLYCLFDRTYDIFTFEEIYEKLDQFNDDVFYIFMQGLSYEEFNPSWDEWYTIDNTERERIINIIEKRKHPRGNKLIDLFK